MTPAPTYQAQLFGPFYVSRDDEPLCGPTWRRASARTLLIWFLLHPRQPVQASRLAELLWPERRDRNQVHVTLHHLRRILEPEPPPNTPSTFIRCADGAYWFDPVGQWQTDVCEVEQLTCEASAAESGNDPHAALGAYRQLIDHFERRFLPEDAYNAIFDDVRHQFEVRHDEALRSALNLALTVGDSYSALSFASSILERDPYAEDAALARANIMLRQGDIRGASHVMDEFTRTLQRELGVQPGPAIHRLRGRIRTPSAAHPPQRRPRIPGTR